MTDPRRPTDSKYDKKGNPLYNNGPDIESKIAQSMPALISEIQAVYSSIQERRTWLPQQPVEQEIHQFYQQLKIPNFNGSPSLLLHGLDPTATASPSPTPLFNADGPPLR